MTLPSIMPDWVPAWLSPWAQLALLVLALLFVFALLMMPFAVFGLKGRLDLIEAQLDDIHAELRMLAMRLPDAEAPRRESRRAAVVEPDPYEQPAVIARRPPPAQNRPPDSRNEARPDIRPPPPPQPAPQPQDRADARVPPLRAEDRAPRREELREPIRDPARDRSEPRLRWPPDGR